MNLSHRMLVFVLILIFPWLVVPFSPAMGFLLGITVVGAITIGHVWFVAMLFWGWSIFLRREG